MASAPYFKVYTADEQYIAACKHPVDAAMILAGNDEIGMTIRNGHAKRNILYTQGVDGNAGESYDRVSEIVNDRLKQRQVN